MHNNFCHQQLEKHWKNLKFVCVGLDPTFEKLPSHLQKNTQNPEKDVFAFLTDIIDATAEQACSFKPNSAYFEALGSAGFETLKQTIDYIHEHYPEVPVILDAKRADIGATSEAYAKAAFEYLCADALTVNAYMGQDSLQPFLDRADKLIFILAKTSNPGSAEFQNLMVKHVDLGEVPLYKAVVYNIVNDWNTHQNCSLVVGATHIQELEDVRKQVGDMPLLVPGVGTQGGSLEEVIKVGLGNDNMGLVINSSRSTLYASSDENFAASAAESVNKMNDEIAALLG